MNRIILIAFTFSTSYCFAQQKQALFYFMTKDSLYGVKDNAGEIIIAAQKVFIELSNEEMKSPITDSLIYLQVKENSKEPHSIGMMYNRKGKQLFAPFFYDNGPDWFSEGLMRFVKNGKVGFANRAGQIIIDAKYDYVSQFNYGIAWYCNGCAWKYKGEHSYVTGGIGGYINFKGDKIEPFIKPNSILDMVIDSNKFLPYQFSYSKPEQSIIDSFYRLSFISSTYFVNHYNKFDSNENKLHYEIVERPSFFYPYYHIKAFEYSKVSGYYGDEITGLNFYADKNGRNFFVFDYYDKKIPLNKWLIEEIKQAKEYLKKHPDAPNKF